MSLGSSDRAVIFGARGFIGQAVSREFANRDWDVVEVTSSDIDLLGQNASEMISDLLRETDRVIFLSILMDRNNQPNAVLRSNLQMATAYQEAMLRCMPRQVCYVSTDGVYPFGDKPVNEATTARAEGLYAAAHLAREAIFDALGHGQTCIVRPTMVFGSHDPHNAYGPNRFLREAQADNKITLFGTGEETRDHIHVADVAALIASLVEHKSSGIYNLATGYSMSFLDVARSVVAAIGEEIPIKYVDQMRPITHRLFDVTKLTSLFPDYKFRNFEGSLRSMILQRDGI
ncbi:SDR family oxidoreductase [Rhodospirillales bacterium]|nr:SDR family oxidoreductase [Rhodospirillales bacterium]